MEGPVFVGDARARVNARITRAMAAILNAGNIVTEAETEENFEGFTNEDVERGYERLKGFFNKKDQNKDFASSGTVNERQEEELPEGRRDTTVEEEEPQVVYID